MKKPVEELFAVVVALAVLALLAVAFVSFITIEGDPFEDEFGDGGQRASALEDP